MQAELITALYARLSAEDDQKGESNSITHQKAILKEYATSHGFTNCRFYVDDGISGATFEREGFQQMIEDVEQGIVGTVIVKDLSRLGRNYLITGQYTEMIFPSYGVRFIAIGDNVDSNEGLGDLIPFSNLINEWYCRDISRKQRAVIQQKGNAGKRLTTRAIYGYKKSAEDKHKWEVDETAAEVVRLIFDLYLNGYGLSKISHYLESKQILCPSAYLGQIKSNGYANQNPYLWSNQTISLILSKQEYCGDTVNFRSERVSYKSKKIIRHDPKDYKVFKDTHEAIISRDVFERVQIRLAQRKRVPPIEEKALFSGYLVCADCGSKLHTMRTRHQANYHATDCYVCAGYRKAIKSCTAHYIREDKLTELVLADIQSVVEGYHENPKAFTKRIQQKLTADGVNNAKQTQKKLSHIVERIAEIEVYIQHLFEEKVKGNISQEVFANLSKKYSDEKAELLAERETLKRVENESKQFVKKFNHFVAVVENIHDVTEVTHDILRELVDRIEVFEGEKIPQSRMKSAKIKVYFNGIGALN